MKGGASGQEEDWTQIRNSMLGETAEHRNKPSNHDDLAGCGGETEPDMLKVGCGSLITKASERRRYELPVGAG